ncbi:MAG: hypothetical protein II866_08840, partial [Prevotella sp.]|nr:hypothetical protein [Prevotella sp.]
GEICTFAHRFGIFGCSKRKITNLWGLAERFVPFSVDSAQFFIGHQYNKMYFSEEFAMLDNIDSLDEDAMKTLLEGLKNMPLSNLSKIELGQFAKYDSSSDMKTMDIRQLLFMLSYRTGDTKTAISLLQVLCNEKSSAKTYYAIAAKYIALRNQGHSNTKIKSILETIYSSSIINEVIDDFTNQKDTFKNYMLSKRIQDMTDEEIKGLLKVIEVYMKLNKSFSSMGRRQYKLKELFV